jgi:isoleucyl-tRNA synthetase
VFVKDGRRYHRVPDVFDCWFESGSMPYAQAHYPFQNKEAFERAFPAQFIAEGLDQTRGWFYTLAVLGTALFDRIPFANCVVNGLVLAEDGTKMSKSKKNYPDPWELFGSFGADALRAYLISSPVVRGEPLKFSEGGVRELVRSVMLPLQHALGFFVTYANLEHDGRGWDPRADGAAAPPPERRSDLDRWILSVLQSLVREVNTQMEGYYLSRVVPPMLAFIDDLTNWYIRRSRRRFWKSTSDDDKAAAYATLYEVLLTFAKVLAPVMPFMAERIYLSLSPGDRDGSVHLADYPRPDRVRIDEELEAAVASVRQAVALGRALREKHRLKTRQPLRRVTIVTHDATARERLSRHAALLADELNVKDVAVVSDDASLAELRFKPNFRALGKRLGPRLKAVGAAIEAITPAQWEALARGATVTIGGEGLTKDDILVSRTPRGEVVLASEGPLTVALDTALDAALEREGLLREALRALQQARAATPGLQVSHRIDLVLVSPSRDLREVLLAQSAWVRDEVLASGHFEVAEVAPPSLEGFTSHAVEVEGAGLQVFLRRLG